MLLHRAYKRPMEPLKSISHCGHIVQIQSYYHRGYISMRSETYPSYWRNHFPWREYSVWFCKNRDMRNSNMVYWLNHLYIPLKMFTKIRKNPELQNNVAKVSNIQQFSIHSLFQNISSGKFHRLQNCYTQILPLMKKILSLFVCRRHRCYLPLQQCMLDHDYFQTKCLSVHQRWPLCFSLFNATSHLTHYFSCNTVCSSCFNISMTC